MNQLTPYAAFFMRLAVGGVFLQHGLTKFHSGIPAVAGFLHGIGFPFASIWAVILIAIYLGITGRRGSRTPMAR